MARGENQALQIALIIFVFVALALGVASFYYFQKLEEQRQVAALKSDEAVAAATKTAQAESERDALKQVIGFEATASLEQVQLGLKSDLEKYAPGLPDAQKNYRLALQLQDQSFQQKNAAVADEQAKVGALEAKNEAREGVKQAQIEQAVSSQTKAQSELAAEAKKYTSAVAATQAQKDAIAQEWNAKQQELNDVVKTARAQVTTVTRELATAQNQVKDTASELQKFNTTTSTVPDGQVVWVDQRTRLAWINLGSADSLPRQQTFSVHPSDVSVMREEGEASTRKASVEVVRVTGPHMAECRIIDYDLNDPVIAGDKIFTPVWHPGRRQHFVLIGTMHINNDGADDRTWLKDVIGQSGGVIDLELLPDGNRAGPGITLNTNYVIKGELPVSTDASDGNAGKVAKAMGDIENEAKNHGARVISLKEFLDDLGYTSRERIYRAGMGDEVSQQGVGDLGKPGFSRPSNSGQFRPRTAPASAYDN